MKYKKYGHHKVKHRSALWSMLKTGAKMHKKGSKIVKIRMKPGIYTEAIKLSEGVCLCAEKPELASV